MRKVGLNLLECCKKESELREHFKQVQLPSTPVPMVMESRSKKVLSLQVHGGMSGSYRQLIMGIQICRVRKGVLV